jgi:hypothetical protein
LRVRFAHPLRGARPAIPATAQNGTGLAGEPAPSDQSTRPSAGSVGAGQQKAAPVARRGFA